MIHSLFRRPARLHELSFFLMTRGLFLTYALLLAAVALLLAGQDPWLAGWYARNLQSKACVLFGVSLIGPLLLEDVLRRTL